MNLSEMHFFMTDYLFYSAILHNNSGIVLLYSLETTLSKAKVSTTEIKVEYHLRLAIKAILSKAEVSAMHNSSGIALSVGINGHFEKE